jgi:hypothetical protein
MMVGFGQDGLFQRHHAQQSRACEFGSPLILPLLGEMESFSSEFKHNALASKWINPWLSLHVWDDVRRRLRASRAVRKAVLTLTRKNDFVK